MRTNPTGAVASGATKVCPSSATWWKSTMVSSASNTAAQRALSAMGRGAARVFRARETFFAMRRARSAPERERALDLVHHPGGETRPVVRPGERAARVGVDAGVQGPAHRRSHLGGGGGELKAWNDGFEILHGCGDGGKAGGQVLIDLVGVNTLYVAILRPERYHTHVQPLHHRRDLFVRPRPKHRHTFAARELGDGALGGGTARADQHQGPASARLAERLEHLEVEEVGQEPDVADPWPRQGAKVRRRRPRRAEGGDLDTVAEGGDRFRGLGDEQAAIVLRHREERVHLARGALPVAMRP